MKKNKGPTNIYLNKLIGDLKKKAIETNEKIWKRVASDLEKPTRSRRVVNLSKISRVTKKDDIIIVPGKVLGTGILNHSLTIVAWSFSDGALQKMELAKAKAMNISDLMKESSKGKKIKIIG